MNLKKCSVSTDFSIQSIDSVMPLDDLCLSLLTESGKFAKFRSLPLGDCEVVDLMHTDIRQAPK